MVQNYDCIGYVAGVLEVPATFILCGHFLDQSLWEQFWALDGSTAYMLRWSGLRALMNGTVGN